MSDVELNVRRLKQLLKAFKGDFPTARVGVLGDKTSRAGTLGDALTNASIGAKHEFGDENLPIRSFLRQPISEHMQAFLDDSGAFDKAALDEIVRDGDLTAWVKKFGIIAEAIVAEAFATGGFQKWKPSDMTHKKVHQTLVETQQLRNSITSDVK